MKSVFSKGWRTLVLLSFIVSVQGSNAFSQCSQVNPIYIDLEKWIHSGERFQHNIEIQVTLINPGLLDPDVNDAGHFFTSWGKSCFFAGPTQCQLFTNPEVALLYSDRTCPSLIPGINNNVNQPFSIQAFDRQVIILDIVNNTITSQSRTWNFEVTYTNVSRKGNTIYGIDDNGSMIILNLFMIDKLLQDIPCTNW